MRTKNSRVPLVLTLSMLMLFHIPRQCLCAYVRVCIPNTYLTQFFLNHLKIETSCPFTSKYISTYFLRTKTFSHITTLQLSTLGNQRSCTIWSTDALQIWPVVPAVPFIGKKKKTQVLLCSFVMSPSSPLIWEQLFSVSFSFMTLTLLKSVGHFVGWPQFGFVWCPLMIRGQECEGRDVVFSVYPPGRYMVYIPLDPGDVNVVDHVVKVMSARFLHCKVIVFPSVIKKCLARRYFETM